MRKHEDSEHADVKPEPQQCLICNTWYRNIDGLKTHQKNMHVDEGAEHRCHICNKTSTTNRALKRHIYLNHICEKKFKCTMCEKAFKRKQDLKEHISVHTGEALYTCPSCPMTFSSSANMYKHRQRLHKAEYAACKSQAMPPNIIKAAKSLPNTLRTKRRFMPSESKQQFLLTPPAVAPPPPLPSALNSQSQSLSQPGGGGGSSGPPLQLQIPPPIITSSHSQSQSHSQPHSPMSSESSTMTARNTFLNPPLLPIKFEGGYNQGYQQFPLKSKLRLHMKIHGGGVTRQVCDKCGKTFQSKYNLSKHIENEHIRVAAEPLQCLICNTWYRNPDGLKAHQKNMHSNTDTEHRCHICHKVSTTHRALLRHINFNHVRERKFKCTMCEKAFKRSQDLKEHISVHTGQPLYTCPKCPMTFASSANMYKHLQRSHKDEYEAQRKQKKPPNFIEQAKAGTGLLMGGEKSTTKKQLQQHRRLDKEEVTATSAVSSTVSNDLPPAATIIQTDAIFPISRKLESHMLTHSEVYNSICDICGNKFKTKYTLKKHIQYYHTDAVRTDKEPQQCKICFKWLRGMKGVKAHMKNIHEDPGGEHRCKICNHLSTTAKGLRVHEVFRHERERKHKCYLCDKAFKRPLDLREHIATHTGESLYKCAECHATFKSNSNYYHHIRRFHKEKPKKDLMIKIEEIQQK
ncbi:zinc finger protein 624-like [Musca vetustissima]|uniref:zinc finger protein 624-like n=1 Tax=Musca vetustissima TaxID=27455 RepID=UPI002AB75D4F|nr:zinc finger protein 624-like [Musca vetustissima]